MALFHLTKKSEVNELIKNIPSILVIEVEKTLREDQNL